MIWEKPHRDQAESIIAATSGLLTIGLLVLAATHPPALPPPGLTDAPKPATVTLSVVEEAPPPPAEAAPPPPSPEPPPPQPQPQALPSKLAPPPPRHRHVLTHAKHLPPPVETEPTDTPPGPPQPQSVAAGRVAQQAPENHSAEGAYIGRLHALVARNTTPPTSAAYRLTHPSGEARIGFTLSRNGALSNVSVIASSGSAILDRQALAIVTALRYPPMPAEVFAGQESHWFVVPVNFPFTGEADGL